MTVSRKRAPDSALVPRTQRSTKWCAAEPGPIHPHRAVPPLGPGSAQQRFALQRVRDTRPCNQVRFPDHLLALQLLLFLV
ncbi:hypothetical protein ABH991_003398 [Bradyrhizobium ottawaense]|uniref:Uncharacterized protein n=1 Tax=Bradyrhizobium ottawaense TaxID=931866 RepID=A0ABV4G7U3_9BRAD